MSIDVRPTRKGLSYRVQFRPSPGANPTSETFATEAGAIAFQELVGRIGGAAARAQRDARSVDRPETITLATWAESYFDSITGITTGTRDSYKAKARRMWLSRLGSLPVQAVTKADVVAWIQWQEAQPSYRSTVDAPVRMQAKTIEDARSLLAQVMEAAVEAGHAATNPVRGVKATKGVAEEMVFLTPAEFGALLLHVPEHYGPLVTLLFSTGLRWGEATALTWGAVELGTAVPAVRVFQAWQDVRSGPRLLGPPKTPMSRRSVSLPPTLIPMLGPPGPSDQYIFRTGGQRAGSIVTHGAFYRAVWTPLVRAINDPEKCAEHGHSPIGKRPRIHDLRHSHASALISQGVNITLVQRRLGHESISTTSDRYGHLAPEAQQVGADASEVALQVALQIALHVSG